MVHEFEELAANKVYQSLVKDAQCYANEKGISLNLIYP